MCYFSVDTYQFLCWVTSAVLVLHCNSSLKNLVQKVSLLLAATVLQRQSYGSSGMIPFSWYIQENGALK